MLDSKPGNSRHIEVSIVIILCPENGLNDTRFIGP